MSRFDPDEPAYVISVAARMIGLHAQTLRYYERVGIVEPSRSRGNIRLYSARDIEMIRRIKGLIDDLGLNLAGVEVIMRLMRKLDEKDRRIEALETELRRLNA